MASWARLVSALGEVIAEVRVELVELDDRAVGQR